MQTMLTERRVTAERRVETPLGVVTLRATPAGLCACTLRASAVEDGPVAAGASAHLDQAERELGEYFASWRDAFTVALDPQGTPFQQSVWDALRAIPFGQTRTYAQLAAMLGNPAAVRAVGRANGANPLWAIVPCHRVIGSDGSLTGYAGGVEIKRRLLVHEGVLLG